MYQYNIVWLRLRIFFFFWNKEYILPKKKNITKQADPRSRSKLTSQRQARLNIHTTVHHEFSIGFYSSKNHIFYGVILKLLFPTILKYDPVSHTPNHIRRFSHCHLQQTSFTAFTFRVLHNPLQLLIPHSRSMVKTNPIQYFLPNWFNITAVKQQVLTSFRHFAENT